MINFDPLKDLGHAVVAAPLWAATGAASAYALGTLGTYTAVPLLAAGITVEGAAIFFGMQPAFITGVNNVIAYLRETTEADTAQGIFSIAAGVAASGLVTAKVIGYSMTLSAAVATQAVVIGVFAAGILGILEWKFRHQDDLDFSDKHEERRDFYNHHKEEICQKLFSPLKPYEPA